MSPGSSEIAAVIQRRWDVLQALRSQPLSKPELVEKCDISRSTVDRAIAEIARQGLCAKDHHSRYRLTPNSQCTVDFCETVGRCFDGISTATSNGLQFDIDEPDVGVMFLDSEIVTGHPHAPDRPLHEFCERLRGTPRFLGFTPVFLREFVEIGLEQLRDGAFSFDLVVSPGFSEYLAADYPRYLRELVTTERANLHEAEVPTCTGLALLGDVDDRSALLLNYGSAGLEGFVESKHRLAVGWAEQVFEERKTKASPVRLRRPV